MFKNLSPLAKRCWSGVALGIFVAVLPLTIAVFGALVDDPDVPTFSALWIVSAPLGLSIALIACLMAVLANKTNPPRAVAAFQRLNRIAQGCWIGGALGLMLAVLPAIVTIYGVFVESHFLVAFHWLLYLSVPLGGAIVVLSALIGIVAMVIKKLA